MYDIALGHSTYEYAGPFIDRACGVDRPVYQNSVKVIVQIDLEKAPPFSYECDCRICIFCRCYSLLVSATKRPRLLWWLI